MISHILLWVYIGISIAVSGCILTMPEKESPKWERLSCGPHESASTNPAQTIGIHGVVFEMEMAILKDGQIIYRKSDRKVEKK